MHILILGGLYHQEDLLKLYKINKLVPRIEIIEDQKFGIDDLLNDRDFPWSFRDMIVSRCRSPIENDIGNIC